MGRVEPATWVAKPETPESLVSYSRGALLQLSPKCGKPKASPDGPSDDLPWSSGSLFCVPLSQLPAAADEAGDGAARTRAVSDNNNERLKATTLMLKNVPFEYTRTTLCEDLAEHGLGYAIDFLYLPVEKSTGTNLGYVYVNVRTEEAYEQFMRVFQGVAAATCLPSFPSSKVCQVCLAEVQGREANMRKLSRCVWKTEISAWNKFEEWQPLFLDDYGQRVPLQEWLHSDGMGKPKSASAHCSPTLGPSKSPILEPQKVISFLSGYKPDFEMNLPLPANEVVPQVDKVIDMLKPSALRVEAEAFVPAEAQNLSIQAA